jgi:CHAT domain-containing protein/tetratricopeptide (TPR) repeat protein
MAMGMFEQIKVAMGQANEAIKVGHQTEAISALQHAKALLAVHITQATSFSAIITMQATLLSLLVGHFSLAQEFATMVLYEVADELERLCKIYQHDLETGQQQASQDIFLCANIYTKAFVPYVPLHPLELEQPESLNVIESQVDSVAAIRFILQHVRPKLDAIGWATWSYPKPIEQKVKFWSARVLVDYGRTLMDNVRSGHDIQTAQFLAKTSLNLLPEEERKDQLAADAFNLLGRAFQAYGDEQSLREAIQPFKECIEILNDKNRDDAAVDRGNLGAIYIKLAGFATANDDKDQAEKDYQAAKQDLTAALAVHRTCPFLEHQLMVLCNLGSLYADQKLMEEAQASFAEAWGVIGQLHKEETPMGVMVAANYGSMLFERGALEEAEALLRRTISTIEKQGAAHTHPENYLLVYGRLGELLRRQGKNSEAHPYLAKALERLESHRHSFIVEQADMALSKTFRWIYEAMIACCASLGRDQASWRIQAFNLAERVKWRMFTTALRFQDLRLPDQQLNPLVIEEEALLKNLCTVALGSPTKFIVPSDIEAITHRLDAIWNAMEPDHPDYVAIRRQKTLEAHEITSLLDSEVPILVEYYLGDELGTALAMVLHADGTDPDLVPLELPETLSMTIDQLLPSQDHQSKPMALADFNEISHDLYRRLIEPIVPLIPEGVGLCIVPCGRLHKVPFGALYDGQRYLIERNPIVIAPSATALRWWKRKNRRAPQRCLLFTATRRTHTSARQMQDLDLFEALARKQIAPLFGKKYKIVKPGEATRTALLQELACRDSETLWDVVHIACHGIFEKNGMDSHLVMAEDPLSLTKDLTALDIFANVRSDATLVTLSACESGKTYVSTGDEIAGLASAFLFGGASSVLASLWVVQQDVGVALTRRFYEIWKGDHNTQQSQSKIKAMQMAELEAFHQRALGGFGSPKWSHPHAWAVFQLYGDWC